MARVRYITFAMANGYNLLQNATKIFYYFFLLLSRFMWLIVYFGYRYKLLISGKYLLHGEFCTLVWWPLFGLMYFVLLVATRQIKNRCYIDFSIWNLQKKIYFKKLLADSGSLISLQLFVFESLEVWAKTIHYSQIYQLII